MIKRWVLAGLVLAASLAAWAPVAAPVNAQEEFDLPEVLTTVDGSLSVRYPAGWVAYGDGLGTQVFGQTPPPGFLRLGTSEAALDPDRDAALEGDELGMVIVAPASVAYAFAMVFPDEFMAAESALDVVEMVLTWADDGTALDEPVEIDLAGHPAASVRYETPGSHNLAAVIDFGGAYAIAVVGGSVDGFAGQEPLVLAILDTLTFVTVDGLIPLTTWMRDLTLAYPPGWLAMEAAPGMVGVVNRGMDFGALAEGEASDAVIVTVVTESALTIFDIVEEIGEPAEVAEAFFEVRVAEKEGVERVALDRPVADDRAYVDYVIGEMVGYVLAREYEGGLVVIWVMAGQDAMDAYADEIDAIIDSIQYPPADE